jgi:hypothetical protein
MLPNKINQNKDRYNVISNEVAESLAAKAWEEQMKNLSYGHKNVKWKKYNPVIKKHIRSAYRKLNEISHNITEVPEDIIELMPSVQWLLDHFQLMYREIKKITTGSYRMLPVLQNAEERGLPRIYEE